MIMLNIKVPGSQSVKMPGMLGGKKQYGDSGAQM